MKKYLKSSSAFIIALSMLAAPVAMAQQNPGHDDGHDQPHMQPMQQQHMQPPMQAPMQHEQPQHEQMPMQHMQPQHQQMSEAHHWQHGQHYTGSRRVVGNWNHYHLRQPPHGYEWVQDGSQFVLIAVASGVIADVLLNSAYH